MIVVIDMNIVESNRLYVINESYSREYIRSQIIDILYDKKRYKIPLTWLSRNAISFSQSLIDARVAKIIRKNKENYLSSLIIRRF